VGVAEHSKAWKYYNGVSKHIQTSRNITFDENDSKLFPIPDEVDGELTIAPLEGESHACERRQPSTEATKQETEDQSRTPQISTTSEPTSIITEPHCSTQHVTRPDYRLHNDPDARIDDKAFVSHESIMAPETYKEAMSREDAPMWKSAMKTEMDQHDEIGTWESVNLPPDGTAIGSRWVFAVKTKPDGSFDKPKARVVAQGFTQ
jgi:hypothetical protein